MRLVVVGVQDLVAKFVFRLENCWPAALAFSSVCLAAASSLPGHLMSVMGSLANVTVLLPKLAWPLVIEVPAARLSVVDCVPSCGICSMAQGAYSQ